MDLSPMEELVFARYLAEGAEGFSMVGRFWPHGDLVLIIEDKIQLACLSFGFRARPACAKVARDLVDRLIAQGGFSTARNDLGVMHQFQTEPYRRCIAQLQEANPTVQAAKAAGPDFWDAAFTAVNEGGALPA